MSTHKSFAVFEAPQKDFFRLIPQEGVIHAHVTAEPAHNAIWDMAVSPKGRVFFSVCGESYNPLFARLYEYVPGTGEFRRHFALEEKMFLEEESVRASKFHTAISFLDEGTIISTIHTTSPSPRHPQWMPYEYEDHIWEGYPGSILFTYDYEKDDFHNLGVMAPRDTTYGAAYDRESGDYFAITWMTGIGYVYNVKTGKRRCLGQVSDTHTSRMFPLPDGCIYGSTYGGEVFRYNPKIGDVEYLGVKAEGLIRHAVYRDGILYFTTGPCSVVGRGQMLYALDIEKREIRTIGRPVPLHASTTDGSAFMNAYGMVMDKEGRLFYGCMTYTGALRYVGARLYMWDFLHGGEPIDCGFLGTPGRTLSITAEMHLVGDHLIISDGNHTNLKDDACGVIDIDLARFVPAVLRGERGPYSSDFVNYLPYPDECAALYPDGDFEEKRTAFDEYYEKVVSYYAHFTAENTPFATDRRVTGISFFTKVGRKNAAVEGLSVDDNGALTILCGSDEHFCLHATKEAGVVSVEKVAPPTEKAAPAPIEHLPYVPGRQYLATATATATLADGSLLVGTSDGMLAKVTKGQVFSLGRVVTTGGVRALVASPDGKTVYGAATYDRGIGRLFTYTEEKGVTLLGILPQVACVGGGFLALYRPTTLAISKNGNYLAVGGMDELGSVALITL